MSLQKRLRFLFRLTSVFLKKQYLSIIFGLVLGCAFFFFLPKIIKFFPRTKKTDKVGVIGQYSVNEIPEMLLREISLGLTSISDRGEAVPSLAERWESSDDGKVFTFYLKNSDIFWHDGKKFSAPDINYNFKDVEMSTDGNKATFKLKESFAPFPFVVSKPLFKKGLIGLGNYKILKINKKGKYIQSIFLVPHNNQNIPPKLYRFYRDERELKTAFNLGEVDFVQELFDLKDLSYGKKVEVKEKLMKDIYLAIFFDTSKSPFSEKTFRQALAYAIPKETGEVRATGPLNPSSWVYNPDVKLYSQDIKHSKTLLEKEKIESNYKIKITTLPQYESVARLAKESWQKIGIESEVQLFSFVPSDSDVLIVARKIPQDPDQYYFWHSTQEGNISHFKSPRIDKLLEDGRKTIINEERKNIYYDFQRYLVEESPVIFLTHPVFYNVTRR